MHSSADADLLAAVARAFAETGAATPGWPDPHPFGRSPRDEEYSRVTDRGRYHPILQARLDAWERVLLSEGLVDVEIDGLVRRFAPARSGDPALLAETTIVECTPYGVVLRLDGDPTELERIPYCGCDACDSGSEELLATLDDGILDVVRRWSWFRG